MAGCEEKCSPLLLIVILAAARSAPATDSLVFDINQFSVKYTIQGWLAFAGRPMLG
jgi:hypothetical protein